MTRHVPHLALLLVCLASASAANERAPLPIDVLFEEGTHLELSLRGTDPDLSGDRETPGLGPVASDDLAPVSGTFGAALKTQITQDLAIGLFYTRGLGTDVHYPADTGYFAAGTRSETTYWSLTPVVKYAFETGVSVYGGVRYQTLSSETEIPFAGGYSIDAEREGDWGYLLGMAYEQPELALRIGLTYTSEIVHALDTTERSMAFAVPGSGEQSGVVSGSVEIVTPRSLTLDAQTAVSEQTLVFGSVRWVEWSAIEVTPPGFSQIRNPATGEPLGALLQYDEDRITYTIGAGRQLSEAWSVYSAVSHQPGPDDGVTDLRPVGGFTGVGVGATFSTGSFGIEAEVSRTWLGDATTVQGGEFEDNTATGIGLRLTYQL